MKIVTTVLLSALVAGVTMLPAQSVEARQRCYDVRVEKRKEVKDDNRILGTALGAVAGGVLGNQVGGGKGKKLATVAGAVGGGYAGNQIQKNNQKNSRETVIERRCVDE
ncbi:MAG: glycine zipper 2TM domain-containing protein [Dokdonella sp.]